jgi:hypothetical protein
VGALHVPRVKAEQSELLGPLDIYLDVGSGVNSLIADAKSTAISDLGWTA